MVLSDRRSTIPQPLAWEANALPIELLSQINPTTTEDTPIEVELNTRLSESSVIYSNSAYMNYIRGGLCRGIRQTYVNKKTERDTNT